MGTNTKDGVVFYTDLPNNVKLDGITINNSEVKGFGANGISIGGWNGTTGYKNVRITNIDAHDSAKAGIITYGQNRWANQNVYVGYSKAYNHLGITTATGNTGSGIALGSVDGGVIEYSSAYNNGQNCKASECGVGIWAYDSNDVVIQYNESYNNKTGSNVDGDGFDLDQNTSNSVLQYNYSHNNDGHGYLICQGSDNGLHTGNVVRYNISENDNRKIFGGAGILVYGTARNLQIYNNTVYAAPNPSASNSPFSVYWWGSAPKTSANISVRNNIFQVTGGLPIVSIASGAYSGGGNIKFQGNNYYSSGSAFKIKWMTTNYTSFTTWRSATSQEMNGTTAVGTSVDPQLTAPGLGGTVGDATNLQSLTAYKLKNTSPMIDKALDMNNFSVNPGTRDFYNTTLKQGAGYDVGAHEAAASYSSTSSPSATTVTAGTPITFTSTFNSALPLKSRLDTEVYGVNGSVFQKFVDVNLTAGTPHTQTVTWNTTGVAPGTYWLYTGIFGPSWTPNYNWQYVTAITIL